MNDCWYLDIGNGRNVCLGRRMALKRLPNFLIVFREAVRHFRCFETLQKFSGVSRHFFCLSSRRNEWENFKRQADLRISEKSWQKRLHPRMKWKRKFSCQSLQNIDFLYSWNSLELYPPDISILKKFRSLNLFWSDMDMWLFCLNGIKQILQSKRDITKVCHVHRVQAHVRWFSQNIWKLNQSLEALKMHESFPDRHLCTLPKANLQPLKQQKSNERFQKQIKH